MKLADIDALKQTFCAECDHSIKCELVDWEYAESVAKRIGMITNDTVRCGK